MRKLVYGAAALTLVSVPGLANENEWSSLDQEINNLSTSLSAQNPAGPKIGGFLKTSFRYSDDTDALFTPGNTEDEMGFKLDKARIEISGDLGQDYSYKVSFELTDSTPPIVRDAYVSWKVAESVKGTMGRFKKPFLRAGLVGDKALLFHDRTALGAYFDVREEGLMFSGNFDTIEWWLAGQNGIDSKEDDFNFTARLVANLMGSGVGKVEGAYGAGEETNLTVGVAYGDEGEYDDGAMIALEAAMTAGPFSVAGNLVDFDKGDSTGSFPSKDGGLLHYGSSNTLAEVDPADSTPWDVTVSYLFTEMYEAAVRYEDADDSDSTTAWSIGVNRYVQGHDIKWTVQVLSADSDLTTSEVTEWTLGLTVGI
jgi:hypothetical protein